MMMGTTATRTLTKFVICCSLLTLCVVAAASSFGGIRSHSFQTGSSRRRYQSYYPIHSSTSSTSITLEETDQLTSLRQDEDLLIPIFGVPRGGGLFGNNDKTSKTDDKSDATAVTEGSGPVVKYPAMTQQEIEEWLEHIPVFAVTDPNGAGVILKPENDTSVFYFFLNPLQANATLQQLKSSNTDINLKVSAFSLGKIWFNILNANNTEEREVLLKSPTSNETSEEDVSEMVKGVQYRLVPDSRDLLGARMLLTLSPEDGEKLKSGGSNSMTPEMVQTAITKAMTQAPKFNTTFNEIPVFTIAQMRMQKQSSADDENSNETPVTFLPMYFSLQNMVGTWQQFMSQAPVDIKDVEPAINLMSLHDIISMMQQESEIDWRHVVLVPPTNVEPGSSSSSSATGAATTATPTVAQMGGATLGDDEDDTDDE